jgi:hypothetical protein
MNATQEPMITMSLTVSQWNLIIAGLGKLPLETSAELWQTIRMEAQAQLQKAQEEAQMRMREELVKS